MQSVLTTPVLDHRLVPANRSVTVRVITSWEEVSHCLSPCWDALLAETAYPSFFQTWGYVDAWWSVYGSDCQLHVLVAEQDGIPVAIAPLAVRRHDSRYGRLVRKLTFLGDDNETFAEYLDFIIPAGREAEVLPHFLDSIQNTPKPPWHLVHLPRVPATSATVGLLSENQSAGSSFSVMNERDSPFVELPATWDEFLQSRSKNFRKTFNRKWNRLHRDHSVRILEGGVDLSIEEAMDAIVRLHKDRWGDKSATFRSGRFWNFHRNLAGRLYLDGNLSLLLMEIDGELAAGRYDFAYNNILWNYQGGRLLTLDHLSPGIVMLAYSVKWAIDRGLHQYDFLIGDAQYKSSWSSQARTLVDLEAVNSRSPVGTAFCALRAIKRSVIKDSR